MVEILIAVFIFALIALGAASLGSSIFSLERISSNRLSSQHQIRRVLKIFTSEVRSASPSSAGAYAISQAGPQSFTFYGDIDSDGLKERVRYSLDGTILRKGVITPVGNPPTYNPDDEVVSDQATDIINQEEAVFSYYDASYDGTTAPLEEPVNPLDVKLVRISLLFDQSTSTPPGPLTLTSQVSIRNLKDNL